VSATVIATACDTIRRMFGKGWVLGLALLTACGGKVNTVADGGAGGTGGASVSSGGGSGGSSTSCTLGASGTYFLAAATSLEPTKPLVFLVDVVVKPIAGTPQMTWTLQPLLWSDRKTPVGTATAWPPVPLGTDGTLDFDPPPVDLPSEANPFSHTPLSVDLAAFRGSFCVQGSFACGTMDGMVTKPIELFLDGSTWTATPISGAFPEPPPTDCNGTLALPVGSWM